MGDQIFGGTGTIGHLFVYDPATGTTTDLGVAVSGQTTIGGLVEGPDGLVYGGTGAYYDAGHLFRFDPADPGQRTDLGVPVAGSTLVADLDVGPGGLIYGGTSDVHTLFSYDPVREELEIVGEVPGISEITCLAAGPDGNLYGGDYPGAQFWFYDLQAGQGGVVGQPVMGEYVIFDVAAGPDGRIYGGTGYDGGHLFAYDIAGGAFEDYGAPVWRDRRLMSLIVGSGGRLYGGTGSARGRLFRFDPADHPYLSPGTATSISISPRMVHQTYVPGTSEVWALAVASDGRVYASGYGNAWNAKLARWDPAVGGMMEDLGSVPGAPDVVYDLLEGPDGKIYGGGGSYATLPNLFSYDPASGLYEYLPPGLVDESFVSALALCGNGLIYGGTSGSGSGDHGLLFSYSPASGDFQYMGRAVAGETSVEALACAPDGTVYGGTGPAGHLFSFDGFLGFADLGQPISGETAVAALAWGPDGMLYGGTVGSGHLFSYDPGGGGVADLGRPCPYDAEIHGLAAGDGLVFGVTGSAEGHLFVYDPAGGALSDLGKVIYRERYAYGLALDAAAQNVYLGTGYEYGEFVVYERGYRYGWLSLDYGAGLPAGTELAVDVLDLEGNLLLPGVPPGASLLGIRSDRVPALQLRATMSTTVPDATPALLDWTVEWTEDAVLAVDPPELTFQAGAGGPDPAPQTLSIGNIGGGELPWALTTDAGWLAAEPVSGTAPSAVSVRAAVDLLPPGTYTTSLEIDWAGLAAGSPDGCANCPVEVPVTLEVYGVPMLSLAPPELALEAVEGQTGPLTAALTVDNVGAGVLTWTASLEAPWLSLAPASGVVPPAATVEVTADPAGLAAGSYEAPVTFDGPPDCGNCPLLLTVTLEVEPRPVIEVSPGSVAVTATAGGPDPVPVALAVTNTGGGQLVWEAQTDAAWAWADPAGGAAGDPLWLYFDISGLVGGQYGATLTVSDAAGLADAVEVPLALTLLPRTRTVYLPSVRRGD